MFRFKEYRFKYYDFRLILFITALSILGVMVIGSAGADNDDKKQFICFLVGLVIMVFLSIVDYHFILKFSWLMYIFYIGLLLLKNSFHFPLYSLGFCIKNLQLSNSGLAQGFLLILISFFTPNHFFKFID